MDWSSDVCSSDLHPQEPPAGRDLHPRQHIGVGEFADPESSHRGDDDAPAVAEDELIAFLARPAVGGGQRHAYRRHAGHEGQRREPRPDNTPPARLAIAFGPYVAQAIADPEKEEE